MKEVIIIRITNHISAFEQPMFGRQGTLDKHEQAYIPTLDGNKYGDITLAKGFFNYEIIAIARPKKV